MHRRHFLKCGLTALAAAGVLRRAVAHPAPAAAHSASAMTPHAAPAAAAAEAAALLPADRLRAGQALRPLPLLRNESTQPGTFAGTLVAEPGSAQLTNDPSATACWRYNQSLPGPLIVLEEGMDVSLTFINRLPEPSTIHWHGLPVPANQDGGPDDPVAPGATRVYRFTLPPGSAGTYWYHPHPHQGVSGQIARGLAGAIVVRAPQDPLAALPEQHWAISDLRLDADAQIPPHTYGDWVDGREGEFVLINGQYRPAMALSGTHRVRIWNMCSARYLNLSLPGCRFIPVGSDGGLLEKVLPAQEAILLSPGERMEVLVTGADGHTSLALLPYNRHRMMSPPPQAATDIATVSYRAAPLPVSEGAALRTIAPLGEPGNQLRAVMMEKMGDIMKNKGGTPPRAFLINGKPFDMARMDLNSKAGVVDRWEIINATTMDHPFHIHGGQFQVTERQYLGKKSAPACLAWKDTVNLRPGEIVRLLMRQDSPGMRMYHCHIIEHEELGMMGMLNVT
ncbi:multicopper oxidase family protein [Chimaeribacter arupi]|uniref:Multicopper oxidase family protein n=2 Tax=Yersiniaceae TaxID=1903411 RepID=A0A2N5EMF9_9GAMM|nr:MULTISPECIES: multicopper oxidase family protein [Yersiniaceae]MBS0968671.1 multicopper oxidase family protein [Nissabacter archeti]MDV5139708.1 multicopper oxidase family protein [Chimaeribacter arupi]PLR46698.1 multicopper oxidase family protein [Chimaeribacter arupi]PLR49252.1 multicopper oxidase family protein [Chimaeribacter arupi]PLR52882.1 multicopper oxidase family protein [Chimaeribacter arupi]